MNKFLVSILGLLSVLTASAAIQYTVPGFSLSGNNIGVNSGGNVAFEMVSGNDREILDFTLASGGNSYAESAAVGGEFFFRNVDGSLINVATGENLNFGLTVNGTDASFAGMTTDGNYLYIGFNTSGNGSMSNGNADYIFRVSGTVSGGTPTGQPLPGALAVLLLGGVAAVIKRRKK